MRTYEYNGEIYCSHNKKTLAKRLGIYHIGPWGKKIWETKNIVRRPKKLKP